MSVEWRNPIFMVNVEKERKSHRRRNKRITYDCQEAKVKGDRVYCKRGKILNTESNDGSIALLFVLRGRTCSRCKDCDWFVKSEEGEE